MIGIVGGPPRRKLGGSGIGVNEEEMNTVMHGWSAKKQILGKPVYNEYQQKIGIIDDLIITRDHLVSYVIIGVGGFLGVGKHDVAISMGQLKEDRDRFLLPTATRYVIKAMPKFECAQR